MTCRCSSPAEHAQRLVSDMEAANARRAKDLADRTPNPDDYVVERVQRVGAHLVMQVRYPSCRLCTYEGLKTLVVLDVEETAAMRWRRIDPHFRGPTKDPREAPSPAARFPGNEQGWSDAMTYAYGKSPPRTKREPSP